MIRGFNLYKKLDKLEFITELKNELANNPLGVNKLQRIFNINIEICYHQFLIYRLINQDFDKAIYTSLGNNNTLYYPLPLQWRKQLEKKGFTTPFIANQLIWYSFVFKWYFIGVLTGLIEIFNFFSKARTNKKSNSVYFENLYPDNLIISDDSSSKTILEWFSKDELSNSIDTMYHNVKDHEDFYILDKKVEYKRNGVPSINSLFKLFKFIIWYVSYSVSALFTSQSMLLFRENIYAKITGMSLKKELHEIYLFHNSGHIFRPLWTYEAEKKGSSIIFYFYSTNIKSFKIKNKKFFQDYQWQVTNWPVYWVWNYDQEIFLKQNVISKKEIFIKGIIPFLSTKRDMRLQIPKKNNKASLLVFDVQPFRSSIYPYKASSVDYYSQDNAILFLNSVNNFAKKNNLNVFIKRKRYNPNVSKKYIRKINELTRKDNWYDLNTSLDPVAAVNLINPKISISMPFTSTAYITKQENIPTLFYDVTGQLDNSFYELNEIELISSEKKLFEWYKTIIS